MNYNNIAIVSSIYSYIYQLFSILFDIIFKFEFFNFFKSSILDPWFVYQYLHILVTLCIDKYSIQIEPTKRIIQKAFNSFMTPLPVAF